ncbi:hypothetical protein D3C77_426700 [compost metagenome]
MGNLFDVGRSATSANSTDIAGLILKAAQRYLHLRGPALRAGVANTPMVRLGIGSLLSGERLDTEVDRAMATAHAAGLCVPGGSCEKAGSYQFSAAEAVFLRKLLTAPPALQPRQLLKYATAVGISDTANLFANYIAYSNSPMPWLHQTAIEEQLGLLGVSQRAAVESSLDEGHRSPQKQSNRVWSQSPPERAGYFWNWSGRPGIEVTLLLVVWSSETGCFQVGEGQQGTSRSVSCAEWGGWWAEVDRPNPSEEIDSAQHALPG